MSNQVDALLRSEYTSQHNNGPIRYWKPVHDKIVGLHLAGWRNVDIAEALDITPITVTRVLADPKGRAIIEGTQKKMREKMRHNIEDALLELSETSVRNIAKTVNEDIPVMSKQKVHQDNVGFRLLAILGYDKKGSGQAPAGGGGSAPLLSEDQGERLLRALSRADEVKEAVEGEDFAIVEDDDQVTEGEPTEGLGSNERSRS